MFGRLPRIPFNLANCTFSVFMKRPTNTRASPTRSSLKRTIMLARKSSNVRRATLRRARISNTIRGVYVQSLVSRLVGFPNGGTPSE